MPKMKKVYRHSTLKGTGPVEDFFNDAGRKISNEFTNPDSLLGQAAKKTEQALGSVFDPNKNGLRQSLEGTVETFKKFARDMPADLKAAFDPNENGVAAAFNKFGSDTKAAFDELGRRIVAQAARDKVEMDKAFAPLRNELMNPDSVLAKFMKQQIGTEEDWKRKFEDPDTYFLIASILLVAASTVVTAPIGGVGAPIAFAAMQTALATSKLITHAAQGKKFDPMDAVAIVLAVTGPIISKAAGKVFAPVGEYLGTVGEGLALDLGVWNQLYGAATPAAPAAGEWIATAGASAASGLAKAAVENQIAYNMRPTEAIGQNFAGMSIANQEAGGRSPVNFPEPPAAPQRRPELDVYTADNIKAAEEQVKRQPQISREEGLKAGREADEDHALQERKKAAGEAYYDYYTGTHMPPTAPQAETEQQREEREWWESRGLQPPANPYNTMYGSGRSSRLLDHARVHRRGRRKSNDSIDSAYFC